MAQVEGAEAVADPPEGEAGTPPEGNGGGTPPKEEGGTPPKEEGGTPPKEEGGTPPEGDGGVPEVATIEDIQLPEGFEISEEDFAGLQSTFEKAGVPFSKELAQGLAEWETSHQQAQQKAYSDAVTARANKWRESAKNDKEFGGDKFDENIVAAEEAFTKLATPELRELVEQSGLGDHPEFIRLFLKIAPSLREERPGAQSGGNSKGNQSLLDRLYGDNN